MNQNKIVNLLNRVLKTNGTKLKKLDEYMYWSPFISHHKPKLQINVKTQKWHCWVSGTGGRTLFQLLKKVNASNQHFDELRELVGDLPHYKKETDTRLKKVVQLPYEFITFGNSTDSIVKRHALSYLYKRGITDDDILKYNIGYCDDGLYSNRIIIPSYDSDGQLNFFVGRDFYNSKMKYRNSPTSKDIIGFDLFINWDEPIILCEGVFDAMAFKRNAIPLFGKNIMSTLQKKIIESRVKVIYLALDNDAIEDTIKISDNFINNGIDVRMIKFKEKDPSEIGFENLLYLINKTTKTKFSDLMRLKLNGKTKKYMEVL
jgi:DNA primase|tara:strand:+ start:89 stop:1039 length:951 start_codon:yes stop_codon:yes gene_type:complete